ncbi:hypothetical protein O3G_MSEX009123 [Manduca sexta]|uniref:N-acetylneuraminate lyase n=1 Tax=Manduca sexta TaxID=7130 RepID=A0A922CQ54_MANSE|nr:hypothetical protein O3G_MSEX009123 [Manduca sexta]
MDDAGNINMTVIPAYAKYLSKCGVQGAVVADIGGEGPSLSISEKKKLFAAWVISGKPFGLKIIGVVGGTSEPEVVELAKYAETINIDALFVLSQPYIEPHTPELITKALKELSFHVPSLPLFYNHCPEYTGLDVHAPTLFKIASEKVPQFKGIALEVKLAVGVIAVNELRKDQNLFISNSIAAGGGTLMGFDAFNLIVLNLFPGLIQDIIKLTSTGDVDRAREEQRKLNTLVATITKQGDYISAQKAAMEIITGLPMGKPRSPLRSISREGRNNIKDILKDCGIDIAKK